MTERTQAMDEQLKCLLTHLPELQKGGVTYLKVEGLEVRIGGAALPEQEREEKQELPAAQDPQTFGLAAGTRMPSLRAMVERVKNNG